MPIAVINGRPQPVARAYGSLRDCAICGEPFTVLSITGVQFYCGDSCKEKASWRRERQRPEIVAANRARCKLWSQTARNVRTPNQWLAGAPPFGEFLPGGAFSLAISPVPHWPIELRNTRALHGLVTGLLGEPHSPQSPGFALIPSNAAASGWGIYVARTDLASKLHSSTVGGVLFDREVSIMCGPLFRIKSPRVTKRGRRLLRIDVLTPVQIRSDSSAVTRLFVTAANLCSTLGAWLPRRLGIELESDAIQLEIVERATQPQTVHMGGKYGNARGFVGHLIVETNAVGEWLLRCAETLGLGGKTAFGFGRIRVAHVLS